MPRTIRLCTWNIQLGRQLEIVAKAIEQHSDFRALDLLALQEASLHSEQEDTRRLAAALGPNYLSYQMTAHTLRGHAQANGLVWNNSRVQLTATGSFRLPRVYEAILHRTERTLLYILPQQPRISIVLEGVLAGESLRVYVAHLDVLGWAHKVEQFNRILSDAQVRQPAVDLTVIMADLNTFRIRSRPSWASLAAAAKLHGFIELTTDILWTHHTIKRLQFRQKLDAIFVRHLRPITFRSWSLDVPGSDHIQSSGKSPWDRDGPGSADWCK